jgi:hypothetical protein
MTQNSRDESPMLFWVISSLIDAHDMAPSHARCAPDIAFAGNVPMRCEHQEPSPLRFNDQKQFNIIADGCRFSRLM